MFKVNTAREDALFNEYLTLLRQMIKNQCVNTGAPDSGHEIRSVETLIEFFKGYGLEGEVFTPRKGRSSLLITLPGSDPGAPCLMLMGHMDVVPVDADSWTHDPFGAEIAEGRLWGRGALDMLGQTAVMAAVIADIYASGVKFPGTLKFLAVADEEAAGIWGAKYLVENHWDRVAADYMLTELGGFYLDLPGHPKATFTLGEKGVTQLRLSATGQASHGSLPFGAENAALKLAEGMTLLGKNPPPAITAGLYTEMVKKLALPSGLESRLTDPLTIDDALFELGITNPGSARILHACSRMTISPNLIQAGSKVNIIAGSGYMEIDIRTLPGQDESDWEQHISSVLGSLGADFQLEVLESVSSTSSEVDTPLMAACRASVRETDPDIELVPMLTSVATDGRFWREKGSVVYGFSLYSRELTIDKGFSMIHGPDESVSLESLRRQLNFYRDIPGRFFEMV
ncbi:MAG: M20/M25/M40 family metallo-hydrolase [Spirochaetales bacterium]|nr:M20/M25/M40 family metallo-hydrolase [Spirochaetales bacterium]